MSVHTRVDPWTMLASRVLAPNPGPMTLEGTNSIVVRDPGSHRVVVVDPGPPDADHLRTLMSLGEIELILLTHHHIDHVESAPRLSDLTGAPVRAANSNLCLEGLPLRHGEVIVAGGTRLTVLATPGHTADSLCFFLPDDHALGDPTRSGSVLTGDTMLGWGTTVIAHPDGSLAAYLDSLRFLRKLGVSTALPAHGPILDDLGGVATEHIRHRLARLADVEVALSRLGIEESRGEVSIAAVTDIVYADLQSELRFAAEMNIAAQLRYIANPPRSTP